MIICGSVRFTEAKLEEIDGSQVMLSISRDEILSLQIIYGQTVEKPVIQSLVAIFMFALGFAIGVWPLLGYLSEPQPKGGGFVASGDVAEILRFVGAEQLKSKSQGRPPPLYQLLTSIGD